MSYPGLDRKRLMLRSLALRHNKVHLPRDAVPPDARPRPLSVAASAILAETVDRIRAARADNRPIMLAMGAHTIKNGLGPVLIELLEQGWLTHLATNGAGVIHDWELAYLGATSEDVRENLPLGEFGTWEETGRWLGLGLLVGAYRGLGYGSSIGSLIAEEGLEVPEESELESAARRWRSDPERGAAAIDLRAALEEFSIGSGKLVLLHPFKAFSVQAAARRRGVPFTGHPMIGHDIIYAHPLVSGAAVGRTGMRDFLCFAEGVSRLERGVYLSVGSAVMSPMIFEKSLSMAQNLARQRGERIQRHFILVVDLAASAWDWQREGEPPADHPAYYLRYAKSFARAGGTMRYLQADNRDFFLHLLHALRAPRRCSRPPRG